MHGAHTPSATDKETYEPDNLAYVCAAVRLLLYGLRRRPHTNRRGKAGLKGAFSQNRIRSTAPGVSVFAGRVASDNMSNTDVLTKVGNLRDPEMIVDIVNQYAECAQRFHPV